MYKSIIFNKLKKNDLWQSSLWLWCSRDRVHFHWVGILRLIKIPLHTCSQKYTRSMQAKNRHVESGRGRGKGPSPLFFSKQTCYIKLNFEGTGYLPYFNGIMSEIAWLVNINLLCFSRFSPHSYHHFQKRCNVHVHEEKAKKYANSGLFLPIVLMRKGVKKITTKNWLI